jgi:putative DNA methylase
LKKKLIEVALPLEAINAESAREKSIRHGHPSTLHLWWARRPLAACRAVLFSSLVDDPSSHPEQFPTEEEQEIERQRLFKLIERLVKWENIADESLYKEAYEEILKSTDSNPPAVLDPFAGGGSIPLEAQRLGLEAHASDLNPVAVMINKAMIEIPPKFALLPPVNPESRRQNLNGMDWRGASGLAGDVRYYGEWMKREAFKRIGHLYPKVKVPKEQGGGEATVIAWIWARTVKCPNPACGCEMPLVHSFELSKKKGNGAFVEPIIENEYIAYVVKRGSNAPSGTVNRRGAKCISCGSPAAFSYIREEGRQRRMGNKLMAIVAEGGNGRIYLSPDETHASTANIEKSENCPDAILPNNPRDFKTPNYGLGNFSDLFTNRQLATLTAFSDIVLEAREKILIDAVKAELRDDGIPLVDGGTAATAYAQAVGVYLAFIVDKLADYNSSICSWHSGKDLIRNTFGRQAIPMVWDYAEANPFSNSSGCFDNMLEWVSKCINNFPAIINGNAQQSDAQNDSKLRNIMLSTDPPYYDNIVYADLSDFFYIWLRRSLKDTYPKLFSTMLAPKTEELVATPYRFDGNLNEARVFFENGMMKTFKQVYGYAHEDVPVTIYYAFKQSESEGDAERLQTASIGWESMISAVIKAGFLINGTWPMRTEMANRSISIGSNALASSIVLVCRKRPTNALSTTRRAFLNELREGLKTGLHDLQSANIAPVDLAQASIGPGMAVYSKYSEVLEADGTPMSVRNALVLINQELDAYLSAQEGNMDTNSRFCIAWFEQYGLSSGKYGDADTLARAKIAHFQELVDDGVLETARGVVRLKKRDELPEHWNSISENTVWTMVQQLCRSLETQGLDSTASHMRNLSGVGTNNIENVKALAYRAYLVAERKGWTDEALAYNSLVTAWPDLLERMSRLKDAPMKQMEFDF